MTHPARYSPEIIDSFTDVLPRRLRPDDQIHDPFAGTGERLGALADDLGFRFSGTEIEPEFIVDERVRVGDATDPMTTPLGRFWIVTSPVYPNGIADHWHARDGSRRRTYRSALASILGHDRPLAENNMGRWGYRHAKSVSNTARMMYWSLATRAVQAWRTGAAVGIVLNVSDFVAAGKVVSVVDPWRDLITSNGFDVVEQLDIETRRWRDGANQDTRVDAETIIIAVRSEQ